jgi:hypothetical protein
LLAACVAAADPQPDADKVAVDVLRDVHNRGAELYNAGDPAGAFRLYEGALMAVRPFLAHHKDVQKVIDDGLVEVAKTDGAKVRAFRLHEVIEDVRGRLKGDKKDAPPKPPTSPVGARPAVAVTGTVTLDGKPAVGVEVTVVTLDLPAPRVFTAKAADGTFAFPEGLPAGKYVVMVTQAPATTAVPEKYRTTGTSGIVIAVAPGAGPIAVDLKSK